MNPISLLSGSKLSMMVIAAFAAVIAVFAVSNSETILTSLGFQTKTAMAADIGKLNAEVKRLTDVNERLVKEVAEAKRVNDIVTEEVVRLENTKGQVATVVTDVKDNKAKQLAAALEALKASTSDQKQNEGQRIKLKEQVAVASINALHEAYTKTVEIYVPKTSSADTDEEVWVAHPDAGGVVFEGCDNLEQQECLA